jgi:hypothetical protein
MSRVLIAVLAVAALTYVLSHGDTAGSSTQAPLEARVATLEQQVANLQAGMGMMAGWAYLKELDIGGFRVIKEPSRTYLIAAQGRMGTDLGTYSRWVADPDRCTQLLDDPYGPCLTNGEVFKP